jgi:hypothetical protein
MTLDTAVKPQNVTVIDGSNPEAIATSGVPYYPEEGKKANYLKYRVSGFGITESCTLADVHHKTVLRWRRLDPEFAKIDTADMETLRKNLAAKYLSIEFTRNYALFLQKDFKLLMRDTLAPGTLTGSERQYLNKVRSFYNPQQLGELKALAEEWKKPDDGTPQDFTKIIFTLQREREIVTGVATKQ